MSFTRRTFLTGAASGLSVLVLAACTPQDPGPTPTPSGSPPPTRDPGVPAPAAFRRSRWGRDQFARGAYSYVAVGSSPDQRADLRAPLDERVFFAGEATSDGNPGTVSGALESGVRAAAEVQAATRGPERIAVIGAGAAGATAARRLAEYGHTVTLIEARDRAGGRIATVTDDGWPFPLELGAWWVRGGGSEALTVALERLGVDTRQVPPVPRLVTIAGDDADPDPLGEQAVRTALDWAAGRPTDVSLSQALRDSGAGDLSAQGDPSPEARLAAHVRDRVTLLYGAPADDLSAWYSAVDTPGTGGPLVLGGFGRLVDDLLDGLDVLFSTPVTAVSYSEGGVSLRFGTGESASVDRAVVAVPLGVLKDEGLTFQPALPFAQRAAVAELGVGVADAVWLRFEEPFWDTDAVLWSVLGADLAIADWVNLEPLTGEPVLVGLVGAQAAERLAELEDDALLSAVAVSLAPFAAKG